MVRVRRERITTDDQLTAGGRRARTVGDLGATPRPLRGGRNQPHVTGTDGQERHSADETKNVRRHQGSRKRLFSPAEASNLGVFGKVVQLMDTATVEHQTRWHHRASRPVFAAVESARLRGPGAQLPVWGSTCRRPAATGAGYRSWGQCALPGVSRRAVAPFGVRGR